MPVEFLGIAATNDVSEITATSGPGFDKHYTLRLAGAHEENRWDRMLFAYGSGSPDPNAAAACIASQVIPIVREEIAKRDQAAVSAGKPTI